MTALSKFLEGYYEDDVEQYKVGSKKGMGNVERATKANIVGLSLEMNCGMVATCTAYRTCHDIDVVFADGYKVYHRHKADFLKRKILNPNLKSEYVGTKVFMKRCGKYAECIAYHDSKHIDIKFEDGVVVEDRAWREFSRGEILHPSVYDGYIGQSIVYKKDGRECICIAYKSSVNVTVQFADYSIMSGLKSTEFTGWTKVSIPELVRDSLLGVSVDMNCGMQATCVEYNSAKDLTIEFDDGYIVYHVHRSSFLNGVTKNPNISRANYPGVSSRVGIRRMMNCGLYCKIIEYRSNTDMTVEFEDGTIVENRRWSSFMQGGIAHPYFGTTAGMWDSMPQRILYYYVSKFYDNVGYCARPLSLRKFSKNGFEIDIFIIDIGVGIEFDGAVPSHCDLERCKRKRYAIEQSDEINQLFVVHDKDDRIVVYDSPKTVNIGLEYVGEKRLYDVYEAAKIILEDLGNDTSSLEWEPDVVRVLYSEGIKVY